MMEEKEITVPFEETAGGAVRVVPKRKKLNVLMRVVTGVGLAAAFVLFFWARLVGIPQVFDTAVFFFILIGTWEMCAAFKAHLKIPQIIFVLVSAAGLFAPYYFWGGLEAVLYYLLAAFVLAACLQLFLKDVTLRGLAATALTLIYPALLMLSCVALNNRPDGAALVLLLFAAVSFTDIFAYTVGSLFGKGRRKLSPTISPNKTVIGAFGGLLGGLAASLLVWLLAGELNLLGLPYILFDGDFPWLHYIITGICLALFTMAGDLFASLLKRKTGVKDYGNIFPGHGGVLDRFDGNIFAAVLLLVYMRMFF
jgi:phosphatidate cytidylyltransferase